MKATRAFKFVFVSCQTASLALALMLGGREGDPFLALSFLFLGAFRVARFYGRYKGEEVTHG